MKLGIIEVMNVLLQKLASKYPVIMKIMIKHCWGHFLLRHPISSVKSVYGTFACTKNGGRAAGLASGKHTLSRLPAVNTSY